LCRALWIISLTPFLAKQNTLKQKEPAFMPGIYGWCTLRLESLAKACQNKAH
jgi:hypothetical protein